VVDNSQECILWRDLLLTMFINLESFYDGVRSVEVYTASFCTSAY
jgi:hypothetical protein